MKALILGSLNDKKPTFRHFWKTIMVINSFMASEREYYVYIITNKLKTVLYTGVTNDLCQRIIEHYLNRGRPETFAGRYNCHFLLYYECFGYIEDAIARGKGNKKMAPPAKNRANHFV
jgi:putative endonuclease